MPISVFNADDHPILRKGLTDLLIESEATRWIGSATNGREALDKIRALQPDVAILDIEMPHLSGIDVARSLIGEGIRTHFILMTLFKDEHFFQNALKIGVKGYLLKESSEQEILDCICSVASGKAYINPNLTHYLIGQNQNEPVFFDKLTEHEKNILKLIARQKTTSEIAEMLFISPKTVSNHRTNISRKLELDGGQNALLKWAIAHRDRLN